MPNVLFAANADSWAEYEPHLTAAFKTLDLEVSLSPGHPPAEVDYIIYAPDGPVQDFTPFTRLKAVLSLWAGVEKFVGNATLTAPLCRMVDPLLEEGMVEWVTGHVLRHHLGMDRHIHAKPGEWDPAVAPPARYRHVGILGLGTLGTACARALHRLNFNTHGWSRSPKTMDGVTCHHGADGLREMLALSEILVVLLPLTPATENVLDASAFAAMPKGAFVINAGRGPLIDDGALIAALDAGQIAHATLDVFRVEPLPEDHPFWRHPGVTVTPHIAAATRPSSASGVIAENIHRSESGAPLLHLVDRSAGY